MVVLCSSKVNKMIMVVLHTLRHIIVHIPVKFSIILCISENCLVNSFNSFNTSFVFLNGSVNLSDERVPVLFVFGSNFVVSCVHLTEVSNNFFFVEVEGESWCSMVKGGIGEGEVLEAEHGDDVVSSWVELLSHESFYFWNNVVDGSTMEVGVGGNIADHLCLSAGADLLSSFDERSEFNPVVFVEDLSLKFIMADRSLPVRHEEEVLFTN